MPTISINIHNNSHTLIITTQGILQITSERTAIKTHNDKTSLQ
jgi:hypothetical protein